MCTVVMDVRGEGAVRLLAVRDEDPHREWDDLGHWWPETYPGVIGIRDRRAGGAWLALHTETQRLAVLLNRADTLDLPEHEVLSRGSLVLESVAGRSPAKAPRTHGFNLLEASPEGSRLFSWDGQNLHETAIDHGVHMIAHGDLDDPTTPRIAAWLPLFRDKGDKTDAADWASTWKALLAQTAELDPEDDRAIIRDNRVHGYPTLSLLLCTAELSADDATLDSHTFARPGHWND